MSVFPGSALRASVLLLAAGCLSRGVTYSLLCSEPTRCVDTGAKLKMYLFRKATNEEFQQAVLMTEVETERNTY